ncbi:uncharacterized protein LOC142228375 [Haematobia irritans]|uniref:Putative secreted protein n=1 Tax=Haematobia irritans TaxID=7368 RepID=A0A1L8EBJ3_HAEIR
MKIFLCCLTILACLLASALSCDPNSDNKPLCTEENLNVPIRNFWDPTAYWLCNFVGEEPELERCDVGHMFDSALGECVMWNKWVWTKPCPDVLNV